ncbi:MAG: hypothetical protein WDZ62_00385 [Candidatus Pacearchaeota archaeon]
MEKFIENIAKAEKTIMAADHMTYVTFPLIKDKRLLLKVIQEIKNAITLCINSILQYEYFQKRINLYKDPTSNFRTFVKKCAPRYNISNEEIETIMELFDIVKKHKESPFEFAKDNKIIILSNSLKPKTLGLENVKEFLILAKNILKKAKNSYEKSKIT